MVASKFPMLLSTTRKGEQRFCMFFGVRESLVFVVEDMHSIDEE
jgi:hypothetical protein